MATMTIIAGLLLVIGGVGLVGAGRYTSRLATNTLAYLKELEEDTAEVSGFHRRLRQPLVRRLVEPLGQQLQGRIASLTPSGYLDNIHLQLLRAGRSSAIRAEEFATIQVLAFAGSVIFAVAWVVLTHPVARLAVAAVAVFTIAGALGPSAWLRRKGRERQDAIVKELPDMVDLLAISVEAGLGFDQAIAAASAQFHSPLAEELALTLKEMELGLSRYDALQNLKRRTDAPQLSNFVLVLSQADALGMPMGRALHAQADELRAKRQQWAREKAGKLPVKIVFPLVLFIFPTIMIVLLGPAMMAIAKGLK